MAQPLAGAELGFIGAQPQPGQHHISKSVKKIESDESWSFDFICSFLLVLSDIQLLDPGLSRVIKNTNFHSNEYSSSLFPIQGTLSFGRDVTQSMTIGL